MTDDVSADPVIPKTIVVRTKKVAWRKDFLASAATTLKDSRLWLIVLPSLGLCGLALVLLKTWLGTAISIAVGLVATRLINNIESLPKPDERELAEGIYRSVLLPAAAGILIIPSSDLLVRLWWMPWHWSHTNDATLPCAYIWIAALLGWLGVLIAPGVTALLTRQRAVFATVVGLMVYIPLNITDSFSGGAALRGASPFAKSCQADFDPSTDADSVGVGIVAAYLTQALMAIFVAKLVSTWLARKNTPSLDAPQMRLPQNNLEISEATGRQRPE